MGREGMERDSGTLDGMLTLVDIHASCLGCMWEPGGWSLPTHACYKLECLGTGDYHGCVGRSTDMKTAQKNSHSRCTQRGGGALFLRCFCR